MPRYMMFITHPENFRVEDVPPSMFQAMDQYVQKNIKSGVLIDTAGLQPSRNGKRVRLQGGKITVKDGPFTETKEVIGGYAICECRDMKHALDVATEFMELHRVHWPAFEGSSEVRPLEVG